MSELEEIVCGGTMLQCKEFIKWRDDPKYFAIVGNDLYRVNQNGTYTILVDDFVGKVDNPLSDIDRA